MSRGEPVASMVGSGAEPAMLTARALLTGNDIAHRWIDTDSDPVGRLLAEHCGLGVDGPVAVFADGSQLRAPVDFVEPAAASAPRPALRSGKEPEQAHAGGGQGIGMAVPARTPPQRAEAYVASIQWRSELARRAGLRTRPEHDLYDVVWSALARQG